MQIRQLVESKFSTETGDFKETLIKIQQWIPAKEEDTPSIKINGGQWRDIPMEFTSGRYFLDPAPEESNSK